MRSVVEMGARSMVAGVWAGCVETSAYLSRQGQMRIVRIGTTRVGSVDKLVLVSVNRGPVLR